MQLKTTLSFLLPSTRYVLYSKFYHINWYQSLVKGLPMNTSNKINAEFRSKVNEVLARHEVSIHQVNTNFENVNTALKIVL